MNYIQNKITGEIFPAPSGTGDSGAAITIGGVSGRIKNFYIATKDKWCPFFNPDGIDFYGDTMAFDSMRDMSKDYLALASDTVTPPAIDCADPVSVSIVSDSTYKSINPDGSTNLFLIVSSISTFDTYEFSTKRSGPSNSNGLDASGYPVTWKAYTKGTNGFYNIDVPSTGVIGNTNITEPVWVRKIGCPGNGYLTSWVTYTPDLKDPLNPPSGPTPPPSGNAVVRAKPMGVTFWGLFGGRQKAPFNGIAEHHHKTHYAEQSASSGTDRSGNSFKHLTPFYAIDGYYTQDANGNLIQNSGSTTVPVGIWSPSSGTHIVENRFASRDWQMTSADMAQCITYLIASGLQFFRFEYYGNGYDGSIPRTLFEQIPYAEKRGVKACYTIGSLSGGDYNDLASEYRQNIEHLISCMGQDWYQKIGGKPMLTYFYNPPSGDKTAWRAEKLTEINLIRNRYNEVYPANNGIYEVYCTSGGSTDMDDAVYFGIPRRTWYYTFDENLNGSHNMDDGNNEGIATTNSLNTSGYKVIPSLNLAMKGLSRAMYPGSTYQWNNGSTTPADIAYNPIWENSYYNDPTDTQLQNYFNDMESLLLLSNVDGGVWGTADEFSEGGSGCWMPRKRADGSIDDRVVRLMNSKWNPNYILP